MSKTILIATPRSGGTAYAAMLSRETNLPFINEPYHLRKGFMPEFYFKVGSYGDDVPDSDCVIHTLTGQFLMKYNDHKYPNENYILLERNDKWAQLLSYCYTTTLYNYGFHNLNYEKKINITVNWTWVLSMLDEWSMFGLLKKQMPYAKHVFYEDIVFSDDIIYKKNKGYENIKIDNIDDIKRIYNLYWK